MRRALRSGSRWFNWWVMPVTTVATWPVASRCLMRFLRSPFGNDGTPRMRSGKGPARRHAGAGRRWRPWHASGGIQSWLQGLLEDE